MRLLPKFLLSICIGIILLFPAHYINAQVVPSSSNLSYLYKDNPTIYLRHQLVSTESKTWILLEVNMAKNIADSLLYGFATTPNLDKPLNSFTKLDMIKFRIYEDEAKQVFAIDVTEVKSKFVVFRIVESSTTAGYTYIVELMNSTRLIFSNSNKLTIPTLCGYVAKDSPLKILTINGEEKEFGVKYYSQPFKPALPPMGDIKQSSPFEKPDTTFTIVSGNIFSTENTGTYAFFNSTNEELTTFFRIEETYYPKSGTINDLIDASIYLLTSEENKKLRSSLDQKKDYDSFWLSNTNSSKRAGSMISAYFSRVEETNKKFTSFKKGWKTDMGMIYIIFGPPDKVYRTNSGMQWIYKKTYELPGFTFTFYANNKYLTSEYYELERGPQFKSIWFRAVELWRKGRKSL